MTLVVGLLLAGCSHGRSSLTIGSAGASAGPRIPEVVVQTGHSDQLTGVGYSPDGRLLASSSLDGTVKLWDLDVGLELRTLRGPTGWLGPASFSADGRRISAGGLDKSVYVWDVATGALLAEHQGLQASVSAVALAPDGATVVAASFQELLVWSVDQPEPVRRNLEGFEVSRFAWSPDGRWLARGTSDDVELWDPRDWQVVRSFPVPDGGGEPALPIFAPDGRHLGIRSGVSSAHLFELDSGRAVLELRDGAPIDGVGFSRGAGDLLVIRADGVTERFAAGTWEPRSSATARVAPRSPDGQRPAASQDSSGFRNVDGVPFTAGHERADAFPMALSVDGSQLAEVWADRSIHRWDLDSGRPLAQLGGHYDFLGPGFVGNLMKQMAVAWSPTAPRLATGGVDRLVHLWDLGNAGGPRTLRGHDSMIAALAFSPDGALLATADVGGAVLLWTATGDPLGQLEADSARDLAFSPDGARLAVGGSDGIVSVWDLGDRKLLWTVDTPGDEISAVRFSADGTRVYVTDRFQPVLGAFESDTGAPVGMDFIHQAQIHAADLHGPTARLLFAGGQSHLSLGESYTVEVNDAMVMGIGRFDGRASSVEFLHQLRGHEVPVWAVKISPDGHRAATGDMNGVIKLWDLDRGTLLASVDGHTSTVTDLEFSHDGRWLVSAGHDHAARVWAVEDLAATATLLTLGADDYVLALDEGHYTASAGGHRGLGFRLGADAYPFEQFDLRLNRPDLVLARFGYASAATIEQFRQAYLHRLTKLGLREDMLDADFHVPEIRIDLDDIPATTTDRQLSFRVLATDSREPLDRVQVWINDVPVLGANGIDLRGADTRVDDRQIDLELGAGVNKIQVAALNQRGGESLRETFEVAYVGDAERPDLWVVAIGVSDYRDDKLDLDYAAKDARDLIAEVEGPGSRWGAVHTLVLTDREASRSNILAAARFLARSRVDDQAVVFLAGHGVLDEDLNYFFLPTDVKIPKWTKTAVSYADLEGLLYQTPARQRLLLMDTCHSGEADDGAGVLASPSGSGPGAGARGLPDGVRVTRDFRGLEFDPGASTVAPASVVVRDLLEELFADLRRGSGAMVISSAGGAEFAMESAEWNNGVFTMAVLEALRRTELADEDGDGQLRVSELRHYVTDRVRTLTAGRQTPTSRQENLEYDFAVLR